MPDRRDLVVQYAILELHVTSRLLALFLTAVAGCAANHPAAAPEASDNAAVPAVRRAQPRPAIGAWGFDTAGMDRSVAPGENFFRYANGRWLAATQIPPDQSNYGMNGMLTELSNERTRPIIEAASGPPGSNGQRVCDYYKTFMDEAAIEANGIAPVQPWLDEIAAIKDAAGVVEQLARRSRLGGNSPFNTAVVQDDREPETYLATLSQGGLGLPDRDMYDDSPSEFRVSVVRNIDAWYDAFQPKPGEALYLPPDQRVKIW